MNFFDEHYKQSLEDADVSKKQSLYSHNDWNTFRISPNCRNEFDCNYMVNWEENDNGTTVDFEISAKGWSLPTDSIWLAIAFSFDQKMVCILRIPELELCD